MRTPHRETHRSDRIGWLRAAVLGANDGALSVASVVVGVAAAGTTPASILLAGVAATVAGAMSMAAGEYVSVQSQVDTEKAESVTEKRELEEDPEGELEELAAIYVGRGLDAQLARRVAEQLTAHDALGSHTRDELGITEALRARPIQAAFSSAGAFAVGASIPLVSALLIPSAYAIWGVGAATLIALMLLGGLAGFAGGASIVRGALRVALWGVVAMVLTAVVGSFFGVSS